MGQLDFNRLSAKYQRWLENLRPETIISDSSWQWVEDASEAIESIKIRDVLYRLVEVEQAEYGFFLALLGAQYEMDCLKQPWSPPLETILSEQEGRGRFYLLAYTLPGKSLQRLPLATLFHDEQGNFHLLERSYDGDEAFWTLLTCAFHLLAIRGQDIAMFDLFGDFMPLGAPSVIQRHSTDRLTKHISRKVVHTRDLCTHCLQCATACNEMRVVASPAGARLLGPSEDFCTNCGLCQKRCTYLAVKPKTEVTEKKDPARSIVEGGSGVYLYGSAAARFGDILDSFENDCPDWLPYETRTIFETERRQCDWLPQCRQQKLTLASIAEHVPQRSMLVSHFNSSGQKSESRSLVRPFCRALVVMQTESGELEKEIASAAIQAGVSVQAVAEPFTNALADNHSGRASRDGGDTRGRYLHYPSNRVSRAFAQMNLWNDSPLLDLWKNRQADIILAPFADQLPFELLQKVVNDTGRSAQVMSPGLPLQQPVTKNPLVNQLAESLQKIFFNQPELMKKESQIARELLEDIPRNHALIYARYRPLAFASGHTACPTCAEAQVLAVPVYMAIAMSLARGEIPKVYFTCETGCMSETLNKMGEVSQKVPGGRTVFGGGFAFAEAMAMSMDRSTRMGMLGKGKRYVVSQGGDGGSVIGLPAWLNALRQQAYMIRQRYPNVLHFINITDTQVYSNTGGESSATSLIGMGTLTTPIGKYLLGNQKIQWTLINLAAEFPNILVGCGHSANKIAMEQFWQTADRLNQSAMRWDVTPCPETGKFFGDDPDDLAEIMAHAGMLPELIFVGRFRKRIAPIHPEDRGKPYREWRRRPRPILYWIQRDPRYRALLHKNPRTGKIEPRNATAHFLITQLKSFRDQLNHQIDLETHLVQQAEDWVGAFLEELRQQWHHYRYQLDQFPYAFLFNRHGEWKPEYGVELEQELIRRILGWQDLAQYATQRDRLLEKKITHTEKLFNALAELESAEADIASENLEQDKQLADILSEIQNLNNQLKNTAERLRQILTEGSKSDPVEEEIFGDLGRKNLTLPEKRKERLFEILDSILEERALGKQTELQQYRLAQQLRRQFLESGGIIRETHAVSSAPEREALRRHIARLGPFSVGVASLAGDRGIAINRIFAQFFTAKGAWAGMAWQFGSSKRGTPVLSATFLDSKPIQRKDGMLSFPMAVLAVTNFEEMKRDPDLFFSQLHPFGFLIINHSKDPKVLWEDLISHYPKEIQETVRKFRNDGIDIDHPTIEDVQEAISQALWQRPPRQLNRDQSALVRKMTAMICATIVSVDMDGIMQQATGASKAVSNLVAVSPIFEALQALGFDFDWDQDLPVLTRGFPGAVLKQEKLLRQYYRAMELARKQRYFYRNEWIISTMTQAGQATTDIGQDKAVAPISPVHDPGEHLMIMGGTLAGMVLSQIAIPEHPLFYVGFPITPAGNPFYAMADAFANGHPYIVVDEMNPSEKVAAEKLLGIARTGGFLPVTFTASQGWRLFTEIIPQFVGARLEGLFLLARRALASPNLNIEESHTDFMTFRDDGGIMLAAKDIQEYVASLYLARLLTHFAKLPVILSIGGITDTHKIGLVKVPSDQRVRKWLRKTLKDFDFLEHKLLNSQDLGIVHGPSGTAAVYQETQSEIEKAHQAVRWVMPHALKAVHELTGVWLDQIEAAVAGGNGNGQDPPGQADTVFILQGSLYPNAVEALRELEEAGWSGLACLSIRWFNPFPEQELWEWIKPAKRVVVLDRSNSFGSIPPLASRVFTSLARRSAVDSLSADGQSSPRQQSKILRTLVGGLGGREITVREMKEILLSTHLLFHPPQQWELELIDDWLDSDDLLNMLLHEAAALELRNTNRHTRVPAAMRDSESRVKEYEAHLNYLKTCLREKNYSDLLANYHQVEFIGAKEFLKETSLLQQLVLHVELRLARHALDTGRAELRHIFILAHYDQVHANREQANRYLCQAIERGEISRRLAQTCGVEEIASSDSLGQGDPKEQTVQTDLDTRVSDSQDENQSKADIQFADREVGLIERILKELVTQQGEKPLFYNPEDYEHELLNRLESEPESQLFKARQRLDPTEAYELRWAYRNCYRDVIDRILQHEVLVQHHAPELRDLFEGEGLKRLEDLARRVRDTIKTDSGQTLHQQISEELERYLVQRCLPRCPKNAVFYLDYFRNWIAPDILQGLEKEE